MPSLTPSARVSTIVNVVIAYHSWRPLVFAASCDSMSDAGDDDVVIGIVSALLSVDNWPVKIALLHFLEQVWGAIAIAVTPATNVIDLTPVPRMTAAPATPHSPIVVHLLEVCRQHSGAIHIPNCAHSCSHTRTRPHLGCVRDAVL